MTKSPRYAAVADVFVLPSLLEALPTVAVEALACGTPVVSADHPGGVELHELFGDDVQVVREGDVRRHWRRRSASAIAIAAARAAPGRWTWCTRRFGPRLWSAYGRRIRGTSYRDGLCAVRLLPCLPCSKPSPTHIADAMRRKDQASLAPLRMLKAALMNKEVEKGRALDEAESLQVVNALVKQRRDSVEQFRRRAARIDLADKEQAEIVFLERYLPPAADPAAIAAAVEAAVARDRRRGTQRTWAR